MLLENPKEYANMALSLVGNDIQRAKDAMMLTVMDASFRSFVIMELDRMEQEIEMEKLFDLVDNE